MAFKRKRHVPYVPKLLPPQPAQITWGSESKSLIIELFQQGRTVDEISSITGNRKAFVRSVVYRYTNPEQFVISSRTKPTKQTVVSCYGCGSSTSSGRWFRNGGIGRICSDCHRSVFKTPIPAKPAKPRISQRVTITCASCNKECSIYPSEQRKNRKYCSKNCYWKARYYNKANATLSQAPSTLPGEHIAETPQLPDWKAFCDMRRGKK